MHHYPTDDFFKALCRDYFEVNNPCRHLIFWTLLKWVWFVEAKQQCANKVCKLPLMLWSPLLLFPHSTSHLLCVCWKSHAQLSDTSCVDVHQSLISQIRNSSFNLEDVSSLLEKSSCSNGSNHKNACKCWKPIVKSWKITDNLTSFFRVIYIQKGKTQELKQH